jgi:hypothetical protein
VSILRHPSETANQYLYVSTITVSQNAILKSLQEQTEEKWTVEQVSTEGQVASGRRKVSEGDFTGMFALVQASGWGTVAGIRANYAVEEKLSNSLLEITGGSLDETIKSVLISSS